MDLDEMLNRSRAEGRKPCTKIIVLTPSTYDPYELSDLDIRTELNTEGPLIKVPKNVHLSSTTRLGWTTESWGT